MMNLFWKSSGINLVSWLITLFIWWGDERIRMIRYSKIWLRLYFGWIYSGQSKSSHFQLRLHLVKSEHLQINWDLTWINLKIYNNNLLSYNL